MRGLPIVVAVLFIASTSRADDVCVVTSYDDLSIALSNCSDIILRGLTVPAQTTLALEPADNSSVTFEGTTTFENATWEGPLVRITGNRINVTGAAGSILNGQGELYWDGLGGSGTTKPLFLSITATGGSYFQGLTLLNCPERCVSISSSDSVTVNNFTIDVSAGDENGGHNTDGFDISSSNDIIIENSLVWNQDDCVAVNSGTDMRFSGLTCIGGHGLSLSVGIDKVDPSKNVVANIVFSGSTVNNSRNGIHIKTHSDGASGVIAGVSYSGIRLSGITNYGINVQEDYENGSSTGNPVGNVIISGLAISDVKGTMTGDDSEAIYVLCGDGGCANWAWSDISITGASKNSSCNYEPEDFTC